MNELIYVVFIDLRFAVLHLKNYGKVTPRTRSKLWRSNQAQNRITTTAVTAKFYFHFPQQKCFSYFLFIFCSFIFYSWFGCLVNIKIDLFLLKLNEKIESFLRFTLYEIGSFIFERSLI